MSHRTAILITMALACLSAAQAGEPFFVASDGNDANPGTIGAPFATIEWARDTIRTLKQRGSLPAGGVTVMIRGGTYERDSSFELTAEDSGTANAPIVYRAYRSEEVRLVGGQAIPPALFNPVASSAVLARLDEKVRANVLRADLKGQGITDYGNVPVRYRAAAEVSELFFNDRRMTLARWPNEGWTTVGKIIKKGSTPRTGDKSNQPGVFEYTGDRPSRWTTADEVWLHGYWCFDWYDEVIKVESIDTTQRQITFAAPHHYGLRYGNRAPRRYRAIDLLEELDKPGEYYIDRKAGMLYFWPPGAMDGARVVVSTLQAPVISLTEVSQVTLRGFTVETCRGDAISIKDGRECQVLSCMVRNTGQSGIVVAGGLKHRVVACDVHDVGTKGIALSGGDRKTLTPSGHEAMNNHIFRFSRRQRTYAHAVSIGGVGNRMAYNNIHHGPHIAIGLNGNDHAIEFNEVHHVCMETDDSGAFYMGRNPSHRGTVIRYNFWHHVGTPMSHGNNCIYFDDGDGGQTVFGNVLFRCGHPGTSTMGAVFCHGGHDNLVENNVFIECKRAIGAGPWNDKRWVNVLRWKTFQTRLLKEVDITKPPYTTRYPQLVGYMDYEPGTKRMNHAVRNVAVMCGDFICGNYVREDNFITSEDPGFVDITNGRFGLREDSIAFKKVPGFKRIPFEEIGLYQDELRPIVPEEPWAYGAPKQLDPPKRRGRPKPKKPKKPAAPKGPVPVFSVPHAQAEVRIDGVIDPQEWGGASPAKAMVLKLDYTGHEAKPLSHAWLAYTDECLLVAVDSEVDPKTSLRGERWGRDDAVEVAIRNVAVKGAAIWVLRGYPTGRVETGSCMTGAEIPRPRPVAGIEFKARVLKPGRWSAEWRIPFKRLGIDPAKHTKLAFNLTVRKAASDLWLMWADTRAHSYDVDKAGFIELTRSRAQQQGQAQ